MQQLRAPYSKNRSVICDYSTWRSPTADKDDPEYYRNPKFLEDYVQHEMPRRINAFDSTAFKCVRPLVESLNSETLRVLDVGCGPGSVFCALGKILKDCDAPAVSSVEYWGVDKVDWKWKSLDFPEYFESRVRRVYATADFLVGDVRSFFRVSDEKFHLIVFNYAGVKNKMDLFKSGVVFKYLDYHGRIIVIDNDIPQVKELADYGLKCENNDRYDLWVYKNEQHRPPTGLLCMKAQIEKIRYERTVSVLRKLRML